MVNRLLTLLFLCTSAIANSQEVAHSIYLIGDAGKDTMAGPALQMLESELKRDSTSTVIFLGDNIYPAGLAGKEGAKKKHLSELKLLSQLETTAEHQGYVFWIPGNHDWKAGRWQGDWLVQLEADFVEEYYSKQKTIKNDSGMVFFPKDGFPGPHLTTVSEHGYDLIAIDVQWWLQGQFFHRVPTEIGFTKRKMEDLFLERLDSLLAHSTRSGRKTILAAHHPMFSNGHHSASKQPWRFIFNWVPPFPLFGLMGLNRALVQDIPQPRYRRIQKKILAVLNKYRNIIYVSGHDHNLQYLENGGNHYLISGAGSKISSLKGDRYGAKFMDDRNYGFMRLDLMESGVVKCHVYGHLTSGEFHSFDLK